MGRLLSIACLISFVSICILHSQVHAAGPAIISFQGKVTNADGTNVTNGSYNFDFVMYDDVSLGTPSDGVHDKWHELTKSVTVTNGVFQTNLGSATALPDFNANPALYLAVRFNADAAGYMTPRVQMASVPYALNADKVGGVAASSIVQLGATQSGNINIGTGSVTAGGATIAGAVSLGTVGTGTASSTVHISDTSNGTGTQLVTIGSTANTANIVTIQGGGAASTIVLQAGASGGIDIGANNVSGKTVNIGSVGTTAQTTTLHLADSSAAAQTVTLGSTSTTSTTTIQGGSGNINLSPSAGNDVAFSQGAGSQLLVTAAAATTIDQLFITNASGATSTTAVDGLGIDFRTTGTTNSADNAGIRIDITSNNNGTTTTLEGLKIGDLTSSEVNSTETGLYVGTGWDIGLDLESGGIQMAALPSNPAAPASGLLRVYAKTVAGRTVLKTIGSAGIDTSLQNALWQNNTVMWTPGVAAGTWQGATGGAVGTAAVVQPTTTNLYTSERRSTYTAATAAANIQNGIRSDAQFFRGNSAGQGGFFAVFHFGTNTWTAGDRLFVGFSKGTTAVTTGNPSALTDIAGFGVDAGDTAITFMHNDNAGTATKDAIAGQPTLASSQGYDAYIYMKPNDSTIYYRLDNTNASTTIVDTSYSTDVITANTMVIAHAAMGTGTNTTTTSSVIGINRIYVETDH